MKKKIFALTVIVCIITVVMAAFVACDGDKLFSSYWEMVVIQNGQGSIIACGPDYDKATSLPKVSVTCTIKVNENIELKYAEGESVLYGKLTEIKTGVDHTKTFSVSFNDGRMGMLYYYDLDEILESSLIQKYGDEKYELVITIGEEYTLYFKRSANIS